MRTKTTFNFPNQVKRRKVYGDITQNATEEELEQLLINNDNHVPSVIAALEDRVRAKGTRYYTECASNCDPLIQAASLMCWFWAHAFLMGEPDAPINAAHFKSGQN